MFCQRSRISDACVKKKTVRVLRRLHDPDDGDILSVFHQVLHILTVIRLITPDLILAVILITVGAVHQFKRDPKNILVRIICKIRRRIHILLIDELLDHLLQFQGITQPHGIEHEIADPAVRCQYQNTLIIVLGPASRLHIILTFIELRVLRHLIEHIRAHHGRHHTVGTGGRSQSQSTERLIRVHLPDIPVFLLIIDLRHCAPSALPPLPADIMDEKSNPVLWICRGYSDRVSSSTVWMY